MTGDEGWGVGLHPYEYLPDALLGWRMTGNCSDRGAKPMTGGGPRLVVPTLAADWKLYQRLRDQGRTPTSTCLTLRLGGHAPRSTCLTLVVPTLAIDGKLYQWRRARLAHDKMVEGVKVGVGSVKVVGR